MRNWLSNNDTTGDGMFLAVRKHREALNICKKSEMTRIGALASMGNPETVWNSGIPEQLCASYRLYGAGMTIHLLSEFRMQLDYTKTTTAPFSTVLENVQLAATKHNFRTLHVHDVQSTLAEKGFEIGPYSIVEVCNAGFAHKVITAHKAVGMFLPCRILLYEEKGATVISLMLPSLIAEMMPGHDFQSIPADVEKLLKLVVDEVAA
jgi:uncharacterized protein (DUF302 family)